MLRNLERSRGLIHSQRVLLALTQKGLGRERAYAAVQRNAMKAWERGADFRSELAADPEVRAALSEAELTALFDLGHHTRHVDTIFRRVFGAA
jgi:adenylosuccinate lyase